MGWMGRTGGAAPFVTGSALYAQTCTQIAAPVRGAGWAPIRVLDSGQGHDPSQLRTPMNPIARIARHARLTSYSYRDLPSPPFLVLFINSICNMKCEHCFYWTSLNKKDDLSRD